jgi:hypothetical protein
MAKETLIKERESKTDIAYRLMSKRKKERSFYDLWEDVKAELVKLYGEESIENIDEDIIGDIFEDELEETEDEAIVPVDKDTLAEIRANFKTADAEVKAAVKTILGNYNGKLANEMRPSDVNKIKEILDI